MKKIFLIIIALLMNSKTGAQQMIPKQKGFEISYSVFPQSPEKQNYALSEGLISYGKNGNYLFGLAEYGRKYNDYTHYDIPIDTFLLNAGYSLHLWGDHLRNVNLNLGLGGLAGYEQINKGNEMIDDGSKINSTENFIYGANGKLSLESYLTEQLVALVNGQLRYLLNSQLVQLHGLFGFGFRFNF
ncbi:conjugal transfer protein TraO [Epilithonimonas ginsengisoli]|uniref:Conjugal transfer protein TraO n=1 Tax=Epilithonimonas ginsengisoli TaxID=1245592 RepID=A0ABU4JMV2_9FLAO|nr:MULTISPECIES: conjugal transfer protein TraO [Chryseobacterium group]MBV6881535.1 conjugal transfer protein TraO [Epilithonimonas sp. FP105]MDW8551021.1 conjugal transfer protein TraO [Epilithonimonas ginsengisoli]OAH70798.1 conjugal transfer protein TraO [Chryseobacterium sp. FP211-J200]